MIEQRVREIVGECAPVEAASLARDDDLSGAGLDSLSVLRVVALVEAEFGFTLPDEDFARLRTLGSLLQAVERHTTAAAV